MELHPEAIRFLERLLDREIEPEALEDTVTALLADEDRPVEAAYLRAHWMLAEQAPEDALELFEEALQGVASTKMGPGTPLLRHGRGLARLVLGDLDEAKADLSHAFLHHRTLAVGLDLGRLLLLQDDREEAESLLDDLLDLEPRDEAEQVELEDLAREIGRDLDPAPITPPDLSYLDPLPDWLQELVEDPLLEAAGLRWLGPEESETETRALRETFDAEGGWPLGTLWTHGLWALACQDPPHARVVGLAPPIPHRQLQEAQPLLILDERGDRGLRIAPDRRAPSFLWLPAGTSGESVLSALGALQPPAPIARAEYPRIKRAFLGYRRELGLPNPYSGEIESAEPHAFARHFVSSPWVMPEHWGSIHLEDPWPRQMPSGGVGMLAVARRQREVQQQIEGGICSFSRKTVFSGSILSLELHQRELWVAELRYRPGQHPELVRALNEVSDAALPEDLPIDLVGALVGLGWMDEAWLRQQMAEAESPVPYLHALAGVLANDTAGLRRLLTEALLPGPDGEPPPLDVQGACFNIASTLNLEWVLDNLRLVGPHPELAPYLDEAARHGFPPEVFDQHGEPIDLYDEDDLGEE